MSKTGIWTLLIAVFSATLFIGAMYFTFDVSDRLFDMSVYKDIVRENGIKADAKIISIDNALFIGGVSLNERKYYEIKMEIDNGKDTPYIVAIDTTTPHGVYINEGDIIPVRINSKNKRKVVYDFGRGDLDIK